MNPSEVAALVIGKPFSDTQAFKAFVKAVENKPEEFLIEVMGMIPEPETEDESGFDALQLSAIVFVGERLAALIAGEILYSPDNLMHDIARKCLSAFPRLWTVMLLEQQILKQSGGKMNKNAQYVLSIVYKGRLGEDAMKIMEN